MDYRVSIVGFLIGFLVGLTSIGGSAFLTPLMILFFNVPPVLAVGVDFVYSTIMKIFGVVTHMRQNHINFKIATYLSLGSIPAVLTSSILIHIFRKQYGSTVNGVILHSLGIVLLLSAGIMLCKPFLFRKVTQLYATNNFLGFLHKHRLIIVICVGAIIGFIIGMTSVGSGSLIFVAISLLYPRLASKEVVGTDIFQSILLLFAGSIVYIFTAEVNWTFVGLLLLGAIPGIILGSRLTKRIPESVFRPILAILLIITAIKLL